MSDSFLQINTISFDVHSSANKGRLCVAKLSFLEGQLISSNEAFCWLLRDDYVDSRCSNCFKASEKLMCCSSCKKVRYCSKECQKLNWIQHKAECKHLTNYNQFSSHMIDDITILLRVICKLNKSLSSEDTVCKVGNKSITCCDAHVHGLSCTPTAFNNDTLSIISIVCKLTKQSMQTVSRLFFQCRSNNFGVTDDLLTCVGVGMYPHAALLNHSCAPNCVLRYSFQSSGPLLHIIALRDIVPGEELCHSYCDCATPRSSRQHNLRETFGFECHCELCDVDADSYEELSRDLLATFGCDSSGPSPVAIRDFFRSRRRSCTSVFNTDEWLLSNLCEPSVYAQVLQRAGSLCRETQLLELSELCGEIEEAEATRLVEEAVRELEAVCGPFNAELYQARGKLMTSYLTAGRLADALLQCKHVVSFLCVALNHIPCHPLLGLQLFTLGDLADNCGDGRLAKEVYAWAAQILKVSHGEESVMYRRLSQVIEESIK